MTSDWRLTNQMNYLYGAALKKAIFVQTGINDHEHCEFCMGKFSEEAGALHAGYCTRDRYWWVCEKCFQDFCAQFAWHIED